HPVRVRGAAVPAVLPRHVRRRTLGGVVFFFQAEDGIRDLIVTGVQTCALPIFVPSSGLVPHHPTAPMFTNSGMIQFVPYFLGERSEERRVGKECRFGWAPNGYVKKDRFYYSSADSNGDFQFDSNLKGLPYVLAV